MPTREPTPEPDPKPHGELTIPGDLESDQKIDPMYLRVTHWMPIIVQSFGLALIGYEALIGHFNPVGVSAGVTLAVGGKLSDILRTGGL